MIDAIELKINSWVQNDAGVCWQFKTFGELADNFDEQNDTKVEPYGIPLSPDILIKAGFVNVRDVHWCVPSEAENAFEICLWNDHVSYTKANGFHVRMNHLHELQNLYFALNNIELNISL